MCIRSDLRTERIGDSISAVLCEGRTPLRVQAEAAGELASHGRLIVNLPTGTGKTLLAALPFAAGLLKARQMVYMTPLRTLASAQAGTIRGEIQAKQAAEALGAPWDVREQTGETPGDPLFEAPCTVCTFDQALSSAVGISYSLSDRRRTLNMGAVLTSYVVADEIHLFPRGEALTTLLWLLKNRPAFPFCLMSATLSKPLVERLGQLLDARVIGELPKEDHARLNLNSRRLVVGWRPEPFDADTVLKLANGHQKVLVVVNTVQRAIDLGRSLADRIGREKVRVLHSRFYASDRKLAEDVVMEALGKDEAERTRGPRVVVATQVIEAGLDVSADVLATELAPASTLVQRWGRCARWGGEGRVIVAPPPTEAVYPYAREKGGPELIERTRTWLEENARDPVQVSRTMEQEFVDFAHGESDQKWLDDMERSLGERTGLVGKAFLDGGYTVGGALVRHVVQARLLVHGRPDQIGDPFSREGFGVAVGVLKGFLRKAGRPVESGAGDGDAEDEPVSLELPEPPEWIAKTPVWDEGAEGRQSAADTPSRWVEIKPKVLPPVVALNPALARYDPFFGLELGHAGEPVSERYWAPQVDRNRDKQLLSYVSETLEEHIRRALKVLDKSPWLLPRLLAVEDELERWLGWPQGLLAETVRASIVLHDMGKLAPGWQKEAKRIQRSLGKPASRWLAHTDSRPGDARFPPHALAGAAYSTGVASALDSRIGQSDRVPDMPSPRRVLVTAVATHHSAGMRETRVGRDFLLDQPARKEAMRLLQLFNLPGSVPDVRDGETIERHLVDASGMRLGKIHPWKEAVALAVVSRMLRLADGESQELARQEKPQGA